MIDPVALARTYAAAFPDGRAWTAAEFKSLIDQPSSILFGDGASFALFSVVVGEAEVITLATHPDHRAQGLAGANLAAAMDYGQENGWTRIFLEVADDNQAALALYRRFDFQTVGRRKGYYRRTNGQQIDALILEKQL